MTYRILHFSDLNLDASFAGQGFASEYGNERRLGLRATLTRIFAKARENKVNAITIGGDLFVQKYLHPETADFIQKQFALLDPIRVIIAPGFQDLYVNESPYSNFNWSRNVDIFYQGRLTPLHIAPKIHLWGACNPPMRGHNLLDGLRLAEGINILLLHVLRGPVQSEVNNISNEVVEKAGFNLALLGGEHVDETLPIEKSKLVFPGSPEPLSPLEENDHHQVVLVEIDGVNIHTQRLSFQQWHYHTIEVDVTNCMSIVDASHCIDDALESVITKTPNSAITVILKGQPHFELNIFDLPKLISASAFFYLESYLGLSYDLEKLASEQTVRGLLVQRFLTRIHATSNESERRQQLTALHFALQALEGKQVSLYETKAN